MGEALTSPVMFGFFSLVDAGSRLSIARDGEQTHCQAVFRNAIENRRTLAQKVRETTPSPFERRTQWISQLRALADIADAVTIGVVLRAIGNFWTIVLDVGHGVPIQIVAIGNVQLY